MTTTFMAANDKLMAVCGRHNIYVYPLSNDGTYSYERQATFFKNDISPLDLIANIPSNSKTRNVGEKLAAVCCDISGCGKYVVAADSGKNIYVFEYNNTWELFASWEMEKRIVKVQFDSRTTFVIMTDKTGDIWTSYMSLKLVKFPKKILGHTSFILDVAVTEDNTQIISCDRDEKVRLSEFPKGYNILDFKLGHKEAIINVAVVNMDNNIISISADGTLKLWKLHDKKEVKSWNIFNHLQDPEKNMRTVKNEVIRMKATDTVAAYHVAVMISGFKVLPVFLLDAIEKKLTLAAHVKIDGDFMDMCWSNKNLYVYSPDHGLVKRYYLGKYGLVFDENFKLPTFDITISDWQAFADYNRPYFPMKKRVGSDILETVAEAKNQIMKKYGQRVFSINEAGTSTGGKTTKSKKKRL